MSEFFSSDWKAMLVDQGGLVAGSAFLAASSAAWILLKLIQHWTTPRSLKQGKEACVWDELTTSMAAQLPQSGQEQEEFKTLLRGAGMYDKRSAARVYALRFLLLTAPLVAAGLLATAAPAHHTFSILFVGALSSALLSATPRLAVLAKQMSRRRAIGRSLPDVLDMLSMCVGGGMPLSPSLAYVTSRIPHAPELAEELTILRRQAEVGNLQIAAADFADRVRIPEAKHLGALLLRGEKLGSQLSHSLSTQSDRLRELRKQTAMRKANRTPAHLVLPLIFCFAPAALLLLVSPAALELADFMSPQNEESVLTGNQQMGVQSLVDGLELMEQDMNQPR